MVRGQTKAPQTAPARNLQKVRIESVSPLGCVRPCAKSSSSLRQILFQLAPNPLPACAIPPQRPSALLPGEGSQSFRGMSQTDDYSQCLNITLSIPFCNFRSTGVGLSSGPADEGFVRLHWRSEGWSNQLWGRCPRLRNGKTPMPDAETDSEAFPSTDPAGSKPRYRTEPGPVSLVEGHSRDLVRHHSHNHIHGCVAAAG